MALPQVTQRILSELVVFATGSRRADPFDPTLVRCLHCDSGTCHRALYPHILTLPYPCALSVT